MECIECKATNPNCPTEVPKGYTVLYCVQGSPPSLSQVTATGGYKPVASVSSVGFQDSSTSSKPACVTSTRGTFFVEKGKTGAVDNPFLCVKKSDDSYGWILLSFSR